MAGKSFTSSLKTRVFGKQTFEANNKIANYQESLDGFYLDSEENMKKFFYSGYLVSIFLF